MVSLIHTSSKVIKIIGQKVPLLVPHHQFDHILLGNNLVTLKFLLRQVDIRIPIFLSLEGSNRGRSPENHQAGVLIRMRPDRPNADSAVLGASYAEGVGIHEGQAGD
jgi:hypothetical protein